MPSLRGEKLVGAVSYADGQFDDARFGLTLAQTLCTAGRGTDQLCQGRGLRQGHEWQVGAVEVEDQLTGEHFQIRAKVFVNCTGPFADHIRLMANPACRSVCG